MYRNYRRENSEKNSYKRDIAILALCHRLGRQPRCDHSLPVLRQLVVSVRAGAGSDRSDNQPDSHQLRSSRSAYRLDGPGLRRPRHRCSSAQSLLPAGGHPRENAERWRDGAHHHGLRGRRTFNARLHLVVKLRLRRRHRDENTQRPLSASLPRSVHIIMSFCFCTLNYFSIA